MSKAKYPNRDALNQALDHYLDAMYQFVSKCLDEQSIRETLRLLSVDDLRKEIEVKDIADLIKKYWSKSFKAKFKIIDRDDVRYYDARSVTSLIIEGRNQVSHQRLKKLDPEFTRSQLFLITEILEKIKRPDAQREVETIQDELFEDTAVQLVKVAVEAEKAKYKKSIAEVESRLASAEKDNERLSKEVDDNAAKLNEKTEELNKLSEQHFSVKLSKQKSEEQFNSTSKRLEKLQEVHSACEKRLTSTETERDDYKEALETILKELKEAETEWQACEDSLAAMRNLFTVAAIGEPEVREVFQSVYPPIETDYAVRILDRRGVDKKNYLLELLEQKQPTLIYVQSEKMVDFLFEHVVPEKADVIEEHGEQTSEAEEVEILEKLQNREKIAVVSDTTFSTMAWSHCVEHFVFCHLVPSLDEFFRRCEPVFASEKNAYLHLIYNSEQDIESLDKWLTQKYPDEEALGELYRELRRFAETDDGFIKPENVYNENIYNKLGMAKLGVETGLAIFEELQFLERSEMGVKVLPDPNKRGLDESEIHCGGEELKQGIVEAQAFQLKQPIKQVWEGIQEKIGRGW